MKKLQNRKGFTLVELLIVMAIIGILLLVAVPRFARSTESATVRTAQANVRILVSAAQTHFADRNAWPTSVAELVTGGYVGEDTFGTDGTPGAVQGQSNTRPAGTTYSVQGNNMQAVVPNITRNPGIEGVTHANGAATISLAFRQ